MVESVGRSMSNAMCTRFTVIGVCILSIAGCPRTPPEVRSFFSFSEFQMPNNSDRRLLFEHTKSIATRTDAFRQREIARFLRDNRIADVTALLEYETRYFTSSIYTVIVITGHDVYQLEFTGRVRRVAKLIISEDEIMKVNKWVSALDGYEGGEFKFGSWRIILVTVYRENKPAFVFYNTLPATSSAKNFKETEDSQNRILCQLWGFLFKAQLDLVDTKTEETGYVERLRIDYK